MHTNKLAKAYIHAETVWVNKAFLKQFNHTNKLAKAYIHAYAHTYINAPHMHNDTVAYIHHMRLMIRLTLK
jgi:hypothetical protein